MSALVQIVIKPQQQEDLEFIYRLGLQKAKLNPNEVIDWRIRKRSLDARKAAIKMNVQLVQVETGKFSLLSLFFSGPKALTGAPARPPAKVNR